MRSPGRVYNGLARPFLAGSPVASSSERLEFSSHPQEHIVANNRPARRRPSRRAPSKPTTSSAETIPSQPEKPKMAGTQMKILREDGGIIWPALDPNFYVPEKHARQLESIHEDSQNEPQNVMLVGHQGCGKSEMAIWFAAKHRRPLIMMNCPIVRETKDWFGYRDAHEGTLTWEKSDFVRACELGNAVILMDEYNRVPPHLHGTLYPLLDRRRQSYVNEIGETIYVAPGTVFFATANIGHRFVGTFTLDAANDDRWGSRIDVGFLPEAVEIDIIVKKTGLDVAYARKLATLAKDVRKKANESMGADLSKSISTRQLLHTATKMKTYLAKGWPVKEVFDYCITPYYSSDGGTNSEQATVMQLIQGIFG